MGYPLQSFKGDEFHRESPGELQTSKHRAVKDEWSAFQRWESLARLRNAWGICKCIYIYIPIYTFTYVYIYIYVWNIWWYLGSLHPCSSRVENWWPFQNLHRGILVVLFKREQRQTSPRQSLINDQWSQNTGNHIYSLDFHMYLHHVQHWIIHFKPRYRLVWKWRIPICFQEFSQHKLLGISNIPCIRCTAWVMPPFCVAQLCWTPNSLDSWIILPDMGVPQIVIPKIGEL